MCEFVEGQLIVSFDQYDDAAYNLVERLQGGLDPNVTRIESMNQKVGIYGLSLRHNLTTEYRLLDVVVGMEIPTLTNLHTLYRQEVLRLVNPTGTNRPRAEFLELIEVSSPPWEPPDQELLDRQFNVQTNGILSVDGSLRSVGTIVSKVLTALAGGKATPVKAANFVWDPMHATYKTMLNVDQPQTIQGAENVKILVIDSGIATDAAFTPTSTTNFLDVNHASTADDDYGHGTVVASIIHEIIPQAEISIYKVIDSNGYVTEWDALAALAADSQAHVINLSLEFGFSPKACATCGNVSTMTMSKVFQSMLSQLDDQDPKPVVVVSAGNGSQTKLAYPSRFGSVVAISSINSQHTLSKFSNHGEFQNDDKTVHDHRFVLPGGDDNASTPESIGKYSGGKDLCGTSFAAAYASGMIATVVANLGVANYDQERVLRQLNQTADDTFSGFDSKKHGAGMITV